MVPFIARAVLWLILGMLLTIPLVWWGLIKKAAITGESWNWKSPSPK